jgi:hypothetical protein
MEVAAVRKLGPERTTQAEQSLNRTQPFIYKGFVSFFIRERKRNK